MSTNYINKITASNGTTYDIAEGVDTRLFTGKCTTSSGTIAKVVTLDDATNFSLVEGVKVAVYFELSNSSATATLNVNSTGAKNIYFGGNDILWAAGETVIFTYDGGSEWIMSSSGGAINYALSHATDSKVAQNYSTTNANYPVLFSAVPGVSSTSGRGNQEARLNNSVYYNPSTETLTAKNLVVNTSILNFFQITTAEFTASGNVSAHSYIAAASKTIPAASRVSGYNLVGIVGVKTSNYRIIPTSCYVTSNTTVFLGYANTTATATTSAPTLTLYLLWARAEVTLPS